MATIGGADAHRTPVGVRVEGEQDIRILLRGPGQQQLDRRGLLGVGKRHRRESRVRVLLFTHRMGQGEPGELEGIRHRPTTNPVQGGVDDAQVRPFRIHPQQIRLAGGDQGDDFIDVPAQLITSRAHGHPGHLHGILHRLDMRFQVGLHLRIQLPTVGQEHLIAVVRGTVVRGGDLHPGIHPPVLHQPGNQGGGARGGQQHHLEPGTGEHLRSGGGEGVGTIAGVITDHHAQRTVLWVQGTADAGLILGHEMGHPVFRGPCGKPAGDPRGGARDLENIHLMRGGTHRCPHACRAEGELTGLVHEHPDPQ